jgi:hypothetical protein
MIVFFDENCQQAFCAPCPFGVSAAVLLRPANEQLIADFA